MQFIEIPRADRHRYLVFRGTGEDYVLIDDFVAPSTSRIEEVSLTDNKLLYHDRSGNVIMTHVPKE